MSKSIRISPWLLTETEADVMDTMVATACINVTAARLSVSRNTIADHLKQCRNKMGQRHTMRAVVLWDRWRRPTGALS